MIKFAFAFERICFMKFAFDACKFFLALSHPYYRCTIKIKCSYINPPGILHNFVPSPWESSDICLHAHGNPTKLAAIAVEFL